MKKSSHTLVLTVGAGIFLLLSTQACGRKAARVQPAMATPPASVTEPRQVVPRKDDGHLSSMLWTDVNPAFFDFDSYTLRDDARAELDRAARALRDRNDVLITIEGHCDERGTVEYNLALGEKRAQAARDYLVRAGIPGARLRVVSHGKERPFDEGHHEAAWALNRRAHLVVR